MKHLRKLRRVAWLAAALVVLWLLSLTLRPGRHTNEMNLVPFSQKLPAVACVLTPGCDGAWPSARFLFVDALGNLAVFVPLGMTLAAATWPLRRGQNPAPRPSRRWWLRIVAAGCLFSLSIELIQLFIPGRATDVDDVILNTLGTAVGAVMTQGLHRLTSNQ